MHALSHIVRIITFVDLFLDARTHHVDKSALPDENTSNHVSHDVIKTALDDQRNKFDIVHYVLTRLNLELFGIALLCFAILSFSCHFYFLRWNLGDGAITEMLRKFLFFLCYPLVQVLLLFSSLWRRIMEVTRPPANDETFIAVRFRARNNDNPNVREIEVVRAD